MFTNKTGIGWTITLVGLAMSAFHLTIAWYGPPDALTLRCVHLGFALTLAFLMLPWSRSHGEADKPRWPEFLLIAASIVVCGYLVVEQEYVVNRMVYVDELKPIDWVFSIEYS